MILILLILAFLIGYYYFLKWFKQDKKIEFETDNQILYETQDKMPVYKDESYGAVVVSGTRKVLLIKQRCFNGSYWALPKGHMEAGETAPDAAIREVNEECGLSLKRSNLVDGIWTSESYQFRGPINDDAWHKHKSFPNANMRPLVNYDKTVYYTLARVDGEPPTKPQADEVDEVGWYPIHEALRMLKHEAQRTVLRRLYEQL